MVVIRIWTIFPMISSTIPLEPAIQVRKSFSLRIPIDSDLSQHILPT